jgi:glucose-6-phosphate isomerase
MSRRFSPRELTIWGINRFDQRGVELGKLIAGAILPETGTTGARTRRDGSTGDLINCLKQLRHA